MAAVHHSGSLSSDPYSIVVIECTGTMRLEPAFPVLYSALGKTSAHSRDACRVSICTVISFPHPAIR